MHEMRWHTITKVVKKNNYKRGAEIGVAKGVNTFNYIKTCHNLHVYAVDMWKPVESISNSNEGGGGAYLHYPHDKFKSQFRTQAAKFKGRVTILEGESTEMAKQVPDASLDFIFVDACHAYEECKADILAWAPKVRPGGAYMGHDFVLPSVQKAVRECLGEPEILGDDDVWYIPCLTQTA